MERDVALQTLGTESWHDRLKAARALTSLAQPDDLQALLAAQASETVSYVKKALDSGIRRVRRDIEEERAVDAESIPPSVMRQVHAKAVEEVARTLLHEIEAIAGAIALAASREVPDYAQSATKAQVDRLEKQLEGITRLKAAAAAPKMVQFSLGSWVKELVAEEAGDTGFSISLVGPENLVVEGDPKLLRLAVCNGLRNAIEAVQERPLELDNGASRIVVSWEATDVECWVAIKDDGARSDRRRDGRPADRPNYEGWPWGYGVDDRQAGDGFPRRVRFPVTGGRNEARCSKCAGSGHENLDR